MNTWFQKHADEVLHEQNVTLEAGLQTEEADVRLARFGKNQLEAGRKINPVALFFGQFKDVLIIILLVAALVSWGVGLVGNETADQTPNESSASTYQTEGICPIDSSGDDQLCEENTTESSGEGAQEALLIFAIVIAIAIIGFFNEYKAEKTVEALKKLVGQKATVRRDGKTNPALGG